MDVRHFAALSGRVSAGPCDGTCETPTDWQQIAIWLDENPGSSITVCKNCIAHPEQVGMRRAVGMPKGQTSDWRFKLDDCRDLHAQEFGSTWRAHLDQWDPKCGAIRHALVDMPKFSIFSSALTSGLIGLAVGSPWRGAAIGAVQGIAAVWLAKATRPARNVPCLDPNGCRT